MESYGDLIRKAREEKNYTYEQVEAATAITKNYLQAIEKEQVDEFPSESYFLGFLSNYCEYVGVKPEEVIRLYHAKKIQESPVPIELTQKKPPKFLAPLLVTLGVLLLSAAGVYLYFFVFKIPEKRLQVAKEVEVRERIHQYQFTGKAETKRFYKGDQILFPTKSGDGNIVLTVASTVGNFALLMPSGTQIVELSEERELDVDGDGFADLIVYLGDVSSDEESYGAEVRLLEKTGEVSGVEIAQASGEGGTELSDIPAASTVKNNANRIVIHEDTRAYPFTIETAFRGSCLFRYKSDRQTYVEDYYKSGDRVSVSSNNGTRLWMSNANALKIKVIAGFTTKDLEVGKAGEVKAEDIKWVRDRDGKYRLVVIDLD